MTGRELHRLLKKALRPFPAWAPAALFGLLFLIHVLLYVGSELPQWAAVALITAIVGGLGLMAHDPLMSSNRVLSEIGDHEPSELAGHFLGVIGVIYAVLLAFVAVVAWQQFDHAEEISMQEQRDVANLHDAAGAFAFPQRDRYKIAKLEELVQQYALNMVGEFQQMRGSQPLCLDTNFQNETEFGCEAEGRTAPASTLNNRLMSQIRVRVLEMQPSGLANQTLYLQSVALFQDLAGVRDHRRRHYGERMPFILWIAFFVGGMVMVSLPYLGQGTRNSARQLVRTLALCIMVGLIIGVTYSFDHPFSGDAGADGIRRWCTVLKGLDSTIARSARFPQACDHG